jgi:CheY-like chemotaxis protein
MRLLVVDDSPIDRLLLTRALTSAFPDAYLRVVGASMKEFEAALEEDPCDLLVADYSLGWADGFGFPVGAESGAQAQSLSHCKMRREGK